MRNVVPLVWLPLLLGLSGLSAWTELATTDTPFDYPVPQELYVPGSYAGRSFYYDKVHLGEDIKLPEGAAVHAIGPGILKEYRPAEGYGELVAVVEHDLGREFDFENGKGEHVKTRYICSIYGHIRKSEKRGGAELSLKVGDAVAKGQTIGYVNDDAHNGDGAEHLHLGIRLTAHPGHWAFFGYENVTKYKDSDVKYFAAASRVIATIHAGSRDRQGGEAQPPTQSDPDRKTGLDLLHGLSSAAERLTSDVGLYHAQAVKAYNGFLDVHSRYVALHNRFIEAARRGIDLRRDSGWKLETERTLNTSIQAADRLASILPVPPDSATADVWLKRLRRDNFLMSEAYIRMIRGDTLAAKESVRFHNSLLVSISQAHDALERLQEAPPGRTARATTGPLAAFSIGNEIYVQSVEGGSLRKAAPSEAQAWKLQRRPLPLTSPDGANRIVPVKVDQISELAPFKVVSAKGVTVLSQADVMRLIDSGLSQNIAFDGWLPDSRHIRIVEHSHISSQENFTWFICDIRTKRILPFNGWLAPNRKWAVVADQQGRAQDRTVHISSDHYHTTGDRNWYVVRMPEDWRTYTFPRAERHPLLLTGIPFALTDEVIHDYDNYGEVGSHIGFVRFTADSRWAVVGDHFITDSGGRVRELPGRNAAILTSTPDAARQVLSGHPALRSVPNRIGKYVYIHVSEGHTFVETIELQRDGTVVMSRDAHPRGSESWLQPIEARGTYKIEGNNVRFSFGKNAFGDGGTFVGANLYTNAHPMSEYEDPGEADPRHPQGYRHAKQP